MNHPTHGELLLLAYGELPNHEAVEAHIATCATCRTELAQLERARAVLDVAMPQRRPRIAPWIGLGLAAAAVVAAVLLRTPPPPAPDDGWQPVSAWSLQAGYVTGGRTMMEIDARLTRLETEGERYYGLPN